MNVFVYCTVAVLAQSTASMLQPERFLTVDVISDSLVVLDAVSGEVHPIGNLGIDVSNVELQLYNDTLYMLTAGQLAVPRLYALDTDTGTANALPPILVPSGVLEFAEGLTADDDGLIAMLDVEPGNSVRSGQIARIDPVTGAATFFGTIPPGVLFDGGDFDGVAYDVSQDVLIGMDGDGGNGGTAIGMADIDTGSTTQVGFISEDDAIGFLASPMILDDALWSTSSDVNGGTSGALVCMNRDGSEWLLVSVVQIATPNVRLFGLETMPAAQPCPADTNGDGIVTPADFNAWVLAFNAQAPECDQNGDGLCTPADFNAWVLNFNAGC